eukprot:COSAG06_NODE_9821_length_1809_cov_1.295906_1_plen_376_part_10
MCLCCATGVGERPDSSLLASGQSSAVEEAALAAGSARPSEQESQLPPRSRQRTAQRLTTVRRPKCRHTARAGTKRQRVDWEAAEQQRQRGAAGWSLERALARLGLARLAHRRLGAESPLIEEEWVRHELVSRVQRCLAECDVAAALGPRLRQHAATLLGHGFRTPPELWAMVAKNRKQTWLVEAGLSGAKLRSARQAVIDALLVHRGRYGGDAEDEQCGPSIAKKRNQLQILEEPAPTPLQVAAEFPGAAVLDGLPAPTSKTTPGLQSQEPPASGSGSGGGGSSLGRAVPQRQAAAAGTELLEEVPAGVVLIVGSTGSGKTTLLRRWAAQAAAAASATADTTSSSPPEDWQEQDVVWDPAVAIISQFGHLSTGTVA